MVWVGSLLNGHRQPLLLVRLHQDALLHEAPLGGLHAQEMFTGRGGHGDDVQLGAGLQGLAIQQDLGVGREVAKLQGPRGQGLEGLVQLAGGGVGQLKGLGLKARRLKLNLD